MHDLGTARFSLYHALAKIENEGFRWDEFQRIFPFGFLGMREGEYLELVKAAALSLPTEKERALLIDMLDMQWITYLEQLWAANEFGCDRDRVAGECHFADARIAINDMARRDLELQPRYLRNALRNQDENSTNLGVFVAGLTGSKDHRTTHPWQKWQSRD